MLGFDMSLWIGGSVLVIGLVQILKTYTKKMDKKFNWVYSVASAIFSILVGIYSGGANVVWDCLGILAVSQLGYEAILQTLLKKLKGE
jgi:hypothetical membrane protein